MIIRPVETYRKVSIKAKIDMDMVSSIGASVFTELFNYMLKPRHLAYELDHVGTFAIRHKNFEQKWEAQLRKASEGQFIKDWEHIPELIRDFRTKKLEFEKYKDEYRQKKAREQSKD